MISDRPPASLLDVHGGALTLLLSGRLWQGVGSMGSERIKLYSATQPDGESGGHFSTEHRDKNLGSSGMEGTHSSSSCAEMRPTGARSPTEVGRKHCRSDKAWITHDSSFGESLLALPTRDQGFNQLDHSVSTSTVRQRFTKRWLKPYLASRRAISRRSSAVISSATPRAAISA